MVVCICECGNSRRQKYRSNDVISAYAASTLMTSEEDKMFQCSLGERQQFSSCTLDVATRSNRSCCHQSEYSIPSAAATEMTCLPSEVVSNIDKSTPPLSLAAYCRPAPVNTCRATGTFLRHHMYETPAVTYSPWKRDTRSWNRSWWPTLFNLGWVLNPLKRVELLIQLPNMILLKISHDGKGNYRMSSLFSLFVMYIKGNFTTGLDVCNSADLVYNDIKTVLRKFPICL